MTRPTRRRGLHGCDQCIAKLGTLRFFAAFHEAGEIVGDDLVAYGASDGLDGQIPLITQSRR